MTAAFRALLTYLFIKIIFESRLILIKPQKRNEPAKQKRGIMHCVGKRRSKPVYATRKQIKCLRDEY